MKFNANKDKTVDAIGPVSVMKAAARTVLEYPKDNFKFSLLNTKAKKAVTTGSKRDDIISKEIGIIEKKVNIPKLLVPAEAYKRGVMVSLPKGQHAFLKCADKKSPGKDKDKEKTNSVFVTDDKKKDPDPITMNALKPDADKAGSEEEIKKMDKDKDDKKKDGDEDDEEKKKKKEEKEKAEKEEEEKKKKEREEKEKAEKEQKEKEAKKEKEKKKAEEEQKKKVEKEEADEKEKAKEEEKDGKDSKGEKNSETDSEEAAFTSNIGNTEFELKMPDNIETYASEKGSEMKNDSVSSDLGEKKHSTSTVSSASHTTLTQTKPESFTQGFSDAKVFEKALTEEGDKTSTDDQLKKQLLSLFDKDMMVSLYKMAIKDLMSELGLRSNSKVESMTSLRGKIDDLKKQQVQLETHYPGIAKSLVAYNKYLPKIEGYLNQLNNADSASDNQVSKRSKMLSSELNRLIDELKKRDFEDQKSFQVDENSSKDEPSYDDCVDENCRHEKQLIKTAHAYFGSLDEIAMKPYQKFYKGEEAQVNHPNKGIKRSSKKSTFSKSGQLTPEEATTDQASVRASLFKALTDASGVDNPEAIVQLAGKLPKVPVRITLNPRGPLAKLHRPIQIDLRPASEDDTTPEIVARTSPGVSVSVPKTIYQEPDSQAQDASNDAYADIKRTIIPVPFKRNMIHQRHHRGKKRGFHHFMRRAKQHVRGKTRHKIRPRLNRKRHHKKVAAPKEVPIPVIKENTMTDGLNTPSDASETSEYADTVTEVTTSEDKSAVTELDKKDPYTEIGKIWFSISRLAYPLRSFITVNLNLPTSRKIFI